MIDSSFCAKMTATIFFPVPVGGDTGISSGGDVVISLLLKFAI
jgi:hypothetical protein